MALDYAQLSDLMNDPVFIGRTRIACLHFANYISGEATNVPAHSTRLRWAMGCFQQPTNAAQQVMPALCQDPMVVDQGSAISDPDLQSATETALQKAVL